MMEGIYVDQDLYMGWALKARHLVSMACGTDSEHYRQFKEGEEPSMYTTNFDMLRKIKAVFLAAKEDYEGGYLSSIRNLVQAEVFSNELEQAIELLSAGYFAASAVVAGVVLETALRQLCKDTGLPISKLDKMNADLAKSGKYNLMMQKQITALADIRNNAAHGNHDQFKREDVQSMISTIERFLAQYA